RCNMQTESLKKSWGLGMSGAQTLCYNRAPFKQQQNFAVFLFFSAKSALKQLPGASDSRSSGGKMTFDETLYARDDEADEFGESGAYGDTLEEDYEEEEEEEEEVPVASEPEPEPVAPPPPPKPAGG